MKSRAWLFAGLVIGFAACVVFSYRALGSNAETDSPESAGDQLSFWGRKQRITGAGKYVAGKLKQGIGQIFGDDNLVGEGIVNQVEGAVKHTAGKVASSAGKVIHDLNG